MAKNNEGLSKGELSTRIGDRIKVLRSELGINQAELARRTNKDPQHIELIENGKVSPNVYTLYIISVSLEVELSEIFK
jgi:transcriptional regulator with XRE-family HTH domain